ncbi:uncharacterized protein LOC122387207 [Amphibalanus amphitrite]|uniref:uncharacterized protein LOC122387207 n=1 Tax=Amphibalanus amphitrite TaxID=1232801 RepID=UPI001C91F047|nr:uncharacterized protein LOC122387207 [Amphibalanus amphitrite]
MSDVEVLDEGLSADSCDTSSSSSYNQASELSSAASDIADDSDRSLSDVDSQQSTSELSCAASSEEDFENVQESVSLDNNVLAPVVDGTSSEPGDLADALPCQADIPVGRPSLKRRVNEEVEDDDGASQVASNCSGKDANCSDAPHISSEELVSLVLSFGLRHGLSNSAMTDLVELMNVISSSSCEMPPTRYLMMKSIASRHERRSFHYYCINEKCRAYVKADQEMCDYCGTPFSMKEAKKEGHFFIHLSLADQLRDLLETGYISKNLLRNERQRSRISDIVDGELYKKHSLLGKGDLSALSISWNFDGLLVHETSGASAWPVLATVNELRPEVRKDQMLMCGIWYGRSKPLWSTMCQPFVDELTSLSTHGLNWVHPTDGTKVTKVIPLMTMCDSPARCMVQAIHQFNGEYGCTWCLQAGTRVATGHGFCRAYPYEEDVPQRTNQSLIRHGQRALTSMDKHYKGVTSVSPLHLLPPCVELDLVNGFPVDYMHCVLLGVTRQLFCLWFEPNDQSFCTLGGTGGHR